MKKSSLVVLTIVAALTMSSCAVQNIPQTPDPVYADATSDTTRQYQPVVTTQVQYDYYYRSRFFDDMYRWWCPRRYYHAITQPNYVPRHKRPIRSATVAVHRSRSMPSSSRRGGFGRTGSTHSATA